MLDLPGIVEGLHPSADFKHISIFFHARIRGKVNRTSFVQFYNPPKLLVIAIADEAFQRFEAMMTAH